MAGTVVTYELVLLQVAESTREVDNAVEQHIQNIACAGWMADV